MRRVGLVFAVLFVLLTGCKSSDSEMDSVISFRQRLLSGNGYTMNASVFADYGDKLYSFSMVCTFLSSGECDFTILEPESISGIEGIIDQSGGYLTVNDHALAFETLADGQITPVTAPWVMFRALRSGYISACGKDETNLVIALDDSYMGKALHLDVWLDQNCVPVRGEILWEGRRILTVEVEDFRFL